MKTVPVPRMASVATLCRLARRSERSRFWYRHAERQLDRAAICLGVDKQRLADLLSIFSPRVHVRRSIRLTIAYLQTGKLLPEVLASTRLALAHYEQTGNVRGVKTGPFARAIYGDSSAIVLDVWMSRALGIRQKQFERKPVHYEASRRVAKAAQRLGWAPAEAQAAIWATAVRQAGRTPTPFVLVDDTLFGDSLVGTK